jgi:3-oxoacyl-[acyl-carrier protein] reductase
MFDLSGRVALVTGGGQNQGAGIARALAAQGAAVAVNDLRGERAEAVAKEIAARVGRALAAPFDVNDLASCRSRASSASSPVVVLVNNAGVPRHGVAQFREMIPRRGAPCGSEPYGGTNAARR